MRIIAVVGSRCVSDGGDSFRHCNTRRLYFVIRPTGRYSVILLKSCARGGGDVDATFRERPLLPAVRPPARGPAPHGPAAHRGGAPPCLVPRLPLRQGRPPRQAERERPRLLPLPTVRTHLQPPRKRAETCRLLTQRPRSGRSSLAPGRCPVSVQQVSSRCPASVQKACSKCPASVAQFSTHSYEKTI